MQDDTDMNFDFDHDGMSAKPQEAAAKAAPVDAGKKAAPTKPKGGGLMGMIKQNWLIIVVGLVAAGAIWYVVSNYILTPSAPARPVVRHVAPAKEQWVSAPAHSVVKAPIKAETNMQPVQQPAQQNVEMTREDMEALVQGFEGVVNQADTNTDTRLSALEANEQTQEQNLNTQIDQLKHAMVVLNQQLTTINTVVDQNTKVLANVDKTVNNTEMQMKLLIAQKAESTEQLTLRAVVPGRAWLMNAGGKTITVVEGTVLPNYGKVINIDSDHGVVTTSSGYVFK